MTRPSIPSVDRLQQAITGYPQHLRLRAARQAVEELRPRALAGEELDEGVFLSRAQEVARSLCAPSMRRVLNFTGVILHTGLGRARLAPEVERRLSTVAASHALVELDPQTGERGDRQEHVRRLLCELTGSEDAHVVNNCAAAVLLSLAALASGRQVVLSRGEMVEIGGSFRMPEVVAQSGCRLVGVGCTNKTRLSDYEEAINDQTAAILRCHPSNFRIVGFTASPSLQDLVDLGRRRGVAVLDDAGSGLLLDLRRFGLAYQPTLADAVATGADLVLASADKLLGGPQAGLILGSKKAVAQVRGHPIARAVRVDKLTLAALEATLGIYGRGEPEALPIWRAFARPLDEIRRDAEVLADSYPGASVHQAVTEVGGGSLPGVELPTWCAHLPGPGEDELAKRLRDCEPLVAASVRDGAVWLDPRTATADEVEEACLLLRRLS